MTETETQSNESWIAYYAESLGNGRAVMRRDIVIDGELVESSLDGSPASLATVLRHERKLLLDSRSDRG